MKKHYVLKMDIHNRSIKAKCGFFYWCNGLDKNSRLPNDFTKRKNDVTCEECLEIISKETKKKKK